MMWIYLLIYHLLLLLGQVGPLILYNNISTKLLSMKKGITIEEVLALKEPAEDFYC